jgi:hypothetical protein
LYRLDGAACDDLLRGRLSDRQRKAIGLLWAATDEEPSSVGSGQPTDLWDSPDGYQSETASETDTEVDASASAGEALSRTAYRKQGTVSPSSYDDATGSGSEYEDSEQSDDSGSASEAEMSSEASPRRERGGLVPQRGDGDRNQGTSDKYILYIAMALQGQANFSSPSFLANDCSGEAARRGCWKTNTLFLQRAVCG